MILPRANRTGRNRILALGALLLAASAGCRTPPPASEPTPRIETPLVAALAPTPEAATPTTPGRWHALDEVLAAGGLTRETCKLDLDDMGFYGGDRFRLHLFDVWMRSPFKIPSQAEYFTRSIESSASTPSDLVLIAGLRLGIGVRRGAFDGVDPKPLAEAAAEQIREALEACAKRTGRPMPEGAETAADRLATECAPAVRSAVLAILRQATASWEWRERAFRAIPIDERAGLFAATRQYIGHVDEGQAAAEIVDAVEENADRMDFFALHAGGMDLARELGRIGASLKGVAFGNGKVLSCPTPLGEIVVGTPGDDTFPQAAPVLAVFDPGGNDQYGSLPVTPDVEHPVSVVIDLGGNDLYVSAEKDRGSAGSAIMGYAILLDYAGDDTYAGKQHAQGAGAYGIGLLADFAGNDRYSAEVHAQGAGSFGIGILADVAGNDRYEMYQLGQGYGYVKGCGILVDRSGNDEYVANDTNIRFPASQTKEHNTSMCQGVGLGKRADTSDGHSLAGGIGILVDGEGNDRYSCGLFGQGCAYWYGIGILSDRAGDDEYRGIWYVQAAAAHFGLGILLDKAGNDAYFATMNMAQGAGHDWSIGFLIDEAGDDRHEAPNLSLGAGNDNGMGIFWDRSGKDAYASKGVTLGQASITAARGNLREEFPCIGMFIDEGGAEDTYPAEKPMTGNDKVWTQPGSDAARVLDTEKGMGGDR